ncbi:MAG: molybdate ABC transporter ATP-binding protein ModF [Pseudomonadota bacterium]
MTDIKLKSLNVQFEKHFQLQDISWVIEPDQHWVVLGGTGSGKSALGAVFMGEGELLSGEIEGLPVRIAIVSFEAQAALIEVERKKDDADILDVISEGTPVREMLAENCENPVLQQALIEAFNFEPLLDQGFRKLSSGESRKLMLIRALSRNLDLLILDEPFEGLDVASCEYLQQLLARLAPSTQTIFILNQFDEVQPFITHVAYMEEGRLTHQIKRSDDEALIGLSQLLHLKTTDLEIPPADNDHRAPTLQPDNPLVRIQNGRVAYGNTIIFKDLDWTIEPGQHWQVTGPNGSGKTCLLNLITGDHPQCYVNDINVFGMQRGNGESIWDIKQYLGYVSSALQWEYNVSVSVKNAIVSGFYDSIGIYQKYTDQQSEIADHWLSLLNMQDRSSQPFSQLSFGDQRLILIARAMVKHPPLLILDEPCLGLDELNRQLVLALIEKICLASETTVLYVNHRSKDRIPGIQNHLEMTLRSA